MICAAVDFAQRDPTQDHPHKMETSQTNKEVVEKVGKWLQWSLDDQKVSAGSHSGIAQVHEDLGEAKGQFPDKKFDFEPIKKILTVSDQHHAGRPAQHQLK